MELNLTYANQPIGLVARSGSPQLFDLAINKDDLFVTDGIISRSPDFAIWVGVNVAELVVESVSEGTFQQHPGQAVWTMPYSSIKGQVVSFCFRKVERQGGVNGPTAAFPAVAANEPTLLPDD
ncbi:unnamed protein product [Vitrella brassicaformis CCMP3155]|uniref:Uncharacterized protein n=1 Tax=Vitrella brassicaformis (strain CCMP3155) TaxID=1169540 RepID=A0A0G4EDT1_VITBC|nr:unnamed protein product [Vitrella brassicaformis CCMP3155]|mmetsp:Transcript_1329/g.3470  ORF Transcript_1329/g.3470 Transcript_1329/m.3470 type:complete len:123 (+) Transcript_1329:558-926(+)|eukprot:CEL93886.1 unnamed protein product [Vitrella brassicaformis CCMP3155]